MWGVAALAKARENPDELLLLVFVMHCHAPKAAHVSKVMWPGGGHCEATQECGPTSARTGVSHRRSRPVLAPSLGVRPDVFECSGLVPEAEWSDGG
jgi:hypothetical protein